MNRKTPPCCKDCGSSSGEGYCRSDFRACPEWLTWFRQEWAEIQRAADIIRKNNEREASKKNDRT